MAEDPVDELPEVTRSVDLDAPLEAVWDAVADPERRGAWLDDEDAAGRVFRLDAADPGRALRWTWWDPDDARRASRVDIELTELASGRTRLVVTERPVVRPRWTGTPKAQARSQASVRAGAHASAWEYRLLGLELLLVTAGVGVF
jgi:uncharacterized protein YndB with AHSA1/START domain